MSRIGNNPITITEGVTVTHEGTIVMVKGKLGELSQEVDSCISVKIDSNTITLSRDSDNKDHRALHGLYRALIANMIEGVVNGYSKKIRIKRCWI
jgi:large subunit ribosomal protein L6